MNLKKLNEELEQLNKKYQVWSPSEEAEEPDVHRSTFDQQGIRDIMMSYFIDDPRKLRGLINNMPDEWVIEFLKHQEDTQVEEVRGE